VEIGPGPQDFQIDLGQRVAIHAIVGHYHAPARICHGVVVQVSSDRAFASECRPGCIP
jgi:hypothetical protein